MMNKSESTARIFALSTIRPCTKLSLDNILLPSWDELGLYGQMLRQCVVTKEQPEGYVYPETEYRMVMRILNGKVMMSGRPDVYCWKHSKVEKAIGKARVIGTTSAEALINLCEVLGSITDPEEKKQFADMVIKLKELLIVRTPAEPREFIRVTQELYDAGVTCCVDSWVEPDENGEGPETQLQVGDALIVEHKPEGTFVYRVGADEFAETYSVDD